MSAKTYMLHVGLRGDKIETEKVQVFNRWPCKQSTFPPAVNNTKIGEDTGPTLR